MNPVNMGEISPVKAYFRQQRCYFTNLNNHRSAQQNKHDSFRLTQQQNCILSCEFILTLEPKVTKCPVKRVSEMEID